MISIHNQRIATFRGAYNVLKAERLLQKEGLPVEAIAAPRQISTDCGICIRFSRKDEEHVRRIIASADLEVIGIFDDPGMKS
jgi:Protein of unknown function (DUF3343)